MVHPSKILIGDFTYHLPEEKIAHYPLEKRDESKLLVYKSGQEIIEEKFKNISNYLPQKTVLVFNNTRVIPARLNFLTDKAKGIEIFCLEPSGYIEVSAAMAAQKNTRWNCLVGNLKQWKQELLSLSKNNITLSAKIFERKQSYVVIEFEWQPAEFSFTDVLENFGAMPIPPYLNRKSEELDTTRYQTIYATENGSVAAPTAGLHFTENVFKSLKGKSVQTTEVTLHVGAGTFKPVKSETLQGHEMHAEWIEVKAEVVTLLMESLEQGIIAVGTTSLRTIESLYWMGVKVLTNPDASAEDLEVGQWDPYATNMNLPDARQSLLGLMNWLKRKNLGKIICKTQILIAPPYDLKIAKGIITNFHQPQSTLLLLISAITGEKWRDIYDYALRNEFRFLSYGDSSLLLK
jgi:S-adenosylmethionine:tRNA ribosyltransferase-isomerase